MPTLAGFTIPSAQKLLRPRTVALVALLGVAALLLLASAALAGRYLLRAVWGSCHSVDCAYLPTTPAVGAIFIGSIYAALVVVVVRQLRCPGKPWGSPRVMATGGDAHPLPNARRLRARRWDSAALLLILLVAAALRLDRLELASFKWGEAISASLGSAILSEGHVNLIGVISSLQVPQLPGYSYLLAPATMFSRDPFMLGILGSLFGLLAVYLCAGVGQRWFGLGIGLAAALLFAVGFWPVHCGSRVWQQCLLPPASLLFLDAVLLLAVAQQPWALVNASLWVGVMTHLHILSPTYLLVLPIAAAFGRARLRVRHVVISLVVFAATMVPFFVWELTPNVWFRDIRHMLMKGTGGGAEFDLTPVRFLAELASAGGSEHLLWPNEQLFLTHAGPWLAFTWLGAILAALGLCLSLYWACAHQARRAPALLLIASLLAPALLLFRHSLPIYAHYLYGTMPILALLGGLAIASLWSAAQRLTIGASIWSPIARLMGAGCVIAIFALYAMGSIQAVSTLNRLVTEYANDEYGVPAVYTWQAASVAADVWRQVGSENPVFVGGHHTDIQPLLYELGGGESRAVRPFDDCKELPRAPRHGPTVLLLWNAESPVADRLLRAGSNLTVHESIPRPGPVEFGLYVVDAAVLDGQEIPQDEASSVTTCQGRV